MGNNKISFWHSWGVIIIAIIVFWPVGIYLLIKRSAVDKKTAMTAGKVVGWIGTCSYAITVLGALVAITEGVASSDVIYIIFYAAAGYGLRKLSKNMIKNAEVSKKYIILIVNGQVRSLDAIAQSTGDTYDKARAQVQKMIDAGTFKDAYINEGLREIVFPTIQQPAVVETNAQPATALPCPCCGANNMVVGVVGECDYCGSAINNA